MRAREKERENSLLTVTFDDAHFEGHKNILSENLKTTKCCTSFVTSVKLGLIEATAHSSFTEQIEQVTTQMRHVLLLIALCLGIYSI